MKAHELRDLSMNELNARLEDEVKALQKLRFTKSVTGQLENPARMRHARKEIARIKTVMKEQVSAE
ncbi:50S ribosomal protein L29 [Balneola sp. MJW-20]|uniref:50S ribosomal protein L29 n=1 Tax=Gracilimonas aurantiaca TaxID=3234185 RepID=UPI00390A1F15